MKTSIAISILILAVVAVFGWNNHQRLGVVTETHRSLAEEAAALGLSIDMNDPEGGVLSTKRARKDSAAEARVLAKELIAFAIEMQGFQERGEEPDENAQQRMMEAVERMLSLDAGQLKTLIAEFRASTEMKDETRTGMISFAIMTLASDHPEAALTLFTESGDLFENGMIGNHLLSSSLANWAGDDPDGALEWVRKNGEKYPDLITDDVKAGLVKGASANGLALGFDLIAELKLKNSGSAISRLAESVKSPAERTEFMALYREYMEKAPEGEDSNPLMLYPLGEGIVKDGFAEGSRWIAENNLSEKEILALAEGIRNNTKSAEKGQWIEWMGENLSEREMNNNVRSTMQEWTRNDYRAAGEWLAATPEGPAKVPAVSAYADTVAAHAPQTAAQWALTLPAGEWREETLKAVYQKWPQQTPQDKAERTAFMAKHPVAD